jgi:hypothetical protein
LYSLLEPVMVILLYSNSRIRDLHSAGPACSSGIGNPINCRRSPHVASSLWWDFCLALGIITRATGALVLWRCSGVHGPLFNPSEGGFRGGTSRLPFAVWWTGTCARRNSHNTTQQPSPSPLSSASHTNGRQFKDNGSSSCIAMLRPCEKHSPSSPRPL